MTSELLKNKWSKYKTYNISSIISYVKWLRICCVNSSLCVRHRLERHWILIFNKDHLNFFKNCILRYSRCISMCKCMKFLSINMIDEYLFRLFLWLCIFLYVYSFVYILHLIISSFEVFIIISAIEKLRCRKPI